MPGGQECEKDCNSPERTLARDIVETTDDSQAHDTGGRADKEDGAATKFLDPEPRRYDQDSSECETANGDVEDVDGFHADDEEEVDGLPQETRSTKVASTQDEHPKERPSTISALETVEVATSLDLLGDVLMLDRGLQMSQACADVVIFAVKLSKRSVGSLWSATVDEIHRRSRAVKLDNERNVVGYMGSYSGRNG